MKTILALGAIAAGSQAAYARSEPRQYPPGPQKPPKRPRAYVPKGPMIADALTPADVRKLERAKAKRAMRSKKLAAAVASGGWK